MVQPFVHQRLMNASCAFASLTFCSKADALLTRETFALTLPHASSVFTLLGAAFATLVFETKALIFAPHRLLSLRI